MRIQRRIFIVLILISVGILNNSFAQTLPDSTIKKIDALFAKWDTSSSPGCTVGIVMNDKLVYSKGFGLANLEYAIPNTPQTIFHMASVSKQFTAYSIILLAEQGKLSLDDDIHKFLSWFPDLKVKITIRNLLNHTSGIRDQWQLLAIAGTRLDDVITQEQIVKLLGRQQALNFKPGEQFSYSNSGFTMLAEIVKKVSGKSLRNFTDSAIFKPLGMTSTHFHDDYTEIEKNRAYSYDRIDSTHFSNSILNYSNAGATSLFTNVTDMSKWIMNVYAPKAGNQITIDQLTINAMLTNGEKLNYAQGIETDTYRGWKQFSHGGSDAGYRTYVSVFPDLKMGFMVFSNLADIRTSSKVYDMADLFINDTTEKITALKKPARDSMAAILKDTSAMKKFLGSYVSEEGIIFNFELKGSNLYYNLQGESNFLIKELKDSFSMAGSPEVKLVFALKARDTLLNVKVPNDKVYHFTKFRMDTLQDDVALKTFTGMYYSAELDCHYGIVLKDHQLLLTNIKYSDLKLARTSPDDLSSDYWWMDHLKMLRGNKNQIIGFEVNSGRVMHLKFVKVK
ncbi:MAG: serine hydrolase domain-containing protein [Ginsengibacter sp.]